MTPSRPTRFTLDPSAENSGDAIIFVHGLAGSPQSTWAKMAECLNGDQDFSGITVDYYSYPTRLIRLPWTPPVPGLRDLAAGLRTFLEEQHGTRRAISIVAHSLGGLIVRHMIASELRSRRSLSIKRLALIAVPSTGATLANVGSLISFPHRQLKSLSKDENSLTTLNIEWEELKAEEAIQVKYILGGSDRTVPTDSAAPYVGRDNKSVIIDADHRSIVAPDSRNDLRYKTVKRFLLDGVYRQESAVPVLDNSRRIERPADPLFDVYTPTNEPYYVQRPFDKVLSEVMARGHVWLTGDSGIGKSAVSRRAVYSSGWHLCHINLSGHEPGNAQVLFRALCSELLSLAQDPDLLDVGKDFASQASLAKRALAKLCSDRAVVNVVEEMPLATEHAGAFAEVIAKFLDLVDADETLYGKVRFAFSSRMRVLDFHPGLDSKVREKIRFLPVETWSNLDIDRLISLLTPAIRPDLSPLEQGHIAAISRGSPRFVKMTFRHWKNGTSENASVETLCARVEREMIP